MNRALTNNYINVTLTLQQFMDYGIAVLRYYSLSPDEQAMREIRNPMCEVFPRIAACNFVRYGTGGRQENQNAICVLSLNMINDKVSSRLLYNYTIISLKIKQVLTLSVIRWG